MRDEARTSSEDPVGKVKNGTSTKRTLDLNLEEIFPWHDGGEAYRAPASALGELAADVHRVICHAHNSCTYGSAGIPASLLYDKFFFRTMSHDQFEAIVAELVESGSVFIRGRDHVLADNGCEFDDKSMEEQERELLARSNPPDAVRPRGTVKKNGTSAGPEVRRLARQMLDGLQRAQGKPTVRADVLLGACCQILHAMFDELNKPEATRPRG